MENLVLLTQKQLETLVEKTLEKFLAKTPPSESKKEEDDLLTPKEAAAYLKIPVSSIYQLRFHEKIRHLYLEGRLRFRQEYLDEILVENTKKAKKKSFVQNKK